MTANRTITMLTLASAAALLLIPGCLERKEKIAVAPDGAVRMELTYSGDLGDFESGDALPDKSTGWRIVDEITTKDNGEKEVERRAAREFAPDEPLPDSFADPAGPTHAVALRFPTTVTIECAADGTYYNFKRVYAPREEARYNVLRDSNKEMFDELDTLTGKQPEELTDADRARIIEILRDVEASKRVEYVKAGAAALENEWPQHYGLLLRQALLDHFEHADIAPLLDLMAQPDSPQRNADIDAFSKQMIAEAHTALENKLNELAVTADQAERFLAACDEEEARRAVTEDIGDESWEITVALPGQIVAHNGDRAENGEVTWEFSGKLMYDREQVLMATSFVPATASEDPTTPTPTKLGE